MTPLQALELLERAAGQVLANRETHVQIMEAAKIVGKALLEREVQSKIAAERVG